MARSMCQDSISTVAQVVDAPVWSSRVVQGGLFASFAAVLFCCCFQCSVYVVGFPCSCLCIYFSMINSSPFLAVLALISFKIHG